MCDGGATAVTSNVKVDARLVGRDGGERGVGSTLADGLAAVKGGVVGRETVDVGVVQDVKRREVLPCQTCSVGWAGRDVGSEERPRPRLGNTVLKPDLNDCLVT